MPCEGGYEVTPIAKVPERAILNVRESGSTLRFLLSVVGALGVETTFLLSGRLGSRPLSPLWEEMERMGCTLYREENTIHVKGRLRDGVFRIPGNVSSQFISGVLLTGFFRKGITVEITGKLESRYYVDMTRAVIARFQSSPPEEVSIEGDWSNAAFFLAANALGSQVTVTGLRADTLQGDRAVTECLEKLEEFCTISAADIPDLIPVLAIVAACKKGAVFADIRRLRLKESDRVQAIVDMVTALGGRAEAWENTLKIHGTGLTGGTVDSCSDHRIAMAAAIAATVCTEPVTILNAHAVDKSYPHFWEDYRRTGGKYEQYIR
jgi:3-phosphoshikimate 1-carboxyvinyltransferase